MYENGLVMRVTRTSPPSGEKSSERTIVGAPIFFDTPVATSTSATCPVA